MMRLLLKLNSKFFLEVVGDMKQTLKKLEFNQQKELIQLLYQQTADRQIIIQRITLNRLKAIIDNLGPV